MIIELPIMPQRGGVKRYKLGFFYFSNNNLSIRKSCAESLGNYDPGASKSEDLDLCFRAAFSEHWVACREPGVVVRHKARKTFFGLMRQLWGWGFYQGRAYSRTGVKGIYIYWVDSKKKNMVRDIEITQFPLLVAAFFTDFHLLHLFLLLAAGGLALGKTAFAALMALCFLWFTARYLSDISCAKFGLWEKTKLAFVQYLGNVVFSAATIIGSIRHGVILIPASILPPTPRTYSLTSVEISSLRSQQ